MPHRASLPSLVIASHSTPSTTALMTFSALQANSEEEGMGRKDAVPIHVQGIPGRKLHSAKEAEDIAALMEVTPGMDKKQKEAVVARWMEVIEGVKRHLEDEDKRRTKKTPTPAEGFLDGDYAVSGGEEAAELLKVKPGMDKKQKEAVVVRWREVIEGAKHQDRELFEDGNGWGVWRIL
ncbi:hypothetical protein BZA77DRAFT_361740 [Pyronema omphalodes]|nr:hypothetical protein BZA77DRAFT_361740 [Pyronema omphalodes]